MRKLVVKAWTDWTIEFEEDPTGQNIKISRFKGGKPRNSMHIPKQALDELLAEHLREVQLRRVCDASLEDLIREVAK